MGWACDDAITVITERVIGDRRRQEAGGERVSIQGQVGTGRPGVELGVENTRRRIKALQRPRGKEREPALE